MPQMASRLANRLCVANGVGTTAQQHGSSLASNCIWSAGIDSGGMLLRVAGLSVGPAWEQAGALF